MITILFTSKYAENLFYTLAYSSGSNLNTIDQKNNSLNYLAKMQTSNPAYGDVNKKKLGFDPFLIVLITIKNARMTCGIGHMIMGIVGNLIRVLI